ncbi:MAG: esterase family protein [Lewinellaceae bacterium]|nr:esterase family protein [Lewinellaceae bacterium]
MIIFRGMAHLPLIFCLASAPLLAQHLTVSAGSLVHIRAFPSDEIDTRDVLVWLPEGYTPQRRYPVLYMQDGQMLFDATVTWNQQEWGVDETMDLLIREGRIREAIVVGIFNHQDKRALEYIPQKPLDTLSQEEIALLKAKPDPRVPRVLSGLFESDAYLRFLVHELKPYIDSHYSTLPDRANTLVAGSSMGGLISLYAICEYPEIFGAAACLSTHWTGIFRAEDNPLPARFMAYLADHLPDPATHRLYFDHGTETLDALYGPFQAEADRLVAERGYKDDQVMSRVFPGTDHSEDAWRARLSIPLTFLLAP